MAEENHEHGHHHGHGHHADPEGHRHHDGAAERNFTSHADNEWGKKFPLAPNTDTAASRITFGKNQRFVNIRGEVKSTQMVTVAVFATPVADPANPLFPLAGGPLVATLNWSGGGGGGQIEFDVPCSGSLPPGFDVSFILDPIAGGGAMVSVPASNIQLDVRNDANLMPNAGQAGATTIGTPLGTDAALTPIAPIVQAVAGYGSKTGKLTRSIWLERGNPGLAPNNQLSCMVPAYARTVRILRAQDTPADVLNVELIAPGPGVTSLLEQINLASGTLCPEIVLGPTTQLTVFSPGTNAGHFSSIVAIFSLENGGEA